MSSWVVYLLQCADQSLYTGISTDVAARVLRHNAKKGAAYTRSRTPVHVVWQEPAASESIARKREAEIKKWPREKKLTLISSRPM
jgi:putative endonuclease